MMTCFNIIHGSMNRRIRNRIWVVMSSCSKEWESDIPRRDDRFKANKGSKIYSLVDIEKLDTKFNRILDLFAVLNGRNSVLGRKTLCKTKITHYNWPKSKPSYPFYAFHSPKPTYGARSEALKVGTVETFVLFGMQDPQNSKNIIWTGSSILFKAS